MGFSRPSLVKYSGSGRGGSVGVGGSSVYSVREVSECTESISMSLSASELGIISSC